MWFFNPKNVTICFGLDQNKNCHLFDPTVETSLISLPLIDSKCIRDIPYQVFIRDHVAVCIISAILGVIILTVSYISSQEAGRLTRDLPTPHNSFTYFNTSLVWLLTSVIISIISTLILCVILYVDSLHFTRATWLIVPIVILGLLPIIQCLIYCRLVKEGSEHRYAWGVFAAVTAARFLQSDRRPAAMYLFVSQLVWFLCHSSAWVAYCVYSIVQDQSDVVFRVWLPIIMPLLLISPLVASLHWSLSLSPVYFSPHAHPDMADTQKRTFSFPPDWKTISGSSVAPDNLAKAGQLLRWKKVCWPVIGQLSPNQTTLEFKTTNNFQPS